MLFAVEEELAAKYVLCFLNLQIQPQTSFTSLSSYLTLLAPPMPPETSLHVVPLTA